jgi:biotin transport system substrate-specific component
MQSRPVRGNAAAGRFRSIQKISKHLVEDPSRRIAVGMIGFCLMTALAAQIRVPVPGTPVPMTLQSTAVLLTGFCLTPVAAAGSMGLYLLLGILGAPVFAAGSAGLLGVTGGYLIGFVPAALVISVIRRGSRHWWNLTLAGIAGVVVIFACGLSWMAWSLGQGAAGAGGIVSAGLVPFLPKAMVQIAVAVAAVQVARSMKH